MESEVLFSILNFEVPLSLFIQWVVVFLLSFIAVLSTVNLKKVPNKEQVVVEYIVEKINNAVTDNMGKDNKKYVPYIGTLILYLGCLNLMGLFGIKPPTTDYNVALGLALISFVVIQANAIKKLGIKHYFRGYAEPLPVLLPINIVERIVFPFSLSLRLFGNIFAATMIMEIVYEGLEHIFKPAMVGIPIPLHAYFDLFDGTLQMIIFVLLTMLTIKSIEEH